MHFLAWVSNLVLWFWIVEAYAKQPKGFKCRKVGVVEKEDYKE